MTSSPLLDHIFDGLAMDLREYGVPVKKVKGWQQRGRDGIWVPQGMLNHHTASNMKAGSTPALGICTNGRSDLPGPLCNFLGARDKAGTIYFVAKGRCNHGGEGGPLKGIPVDSANAYMLAYEGENNGLGESWFDGKQYDSMVILNAFVMIRLKKNAAWMSAGHKEWTPRKIDPNHGFGMDGFREDVRRQMKRIRKDGYPSKEGGRR